MPHSIPEGFFKDEAGELQQDRRVKRQDRRSDRKDFSDGDRRNRQRRVSDEAMLEREHHKQIEDALEDFAEDHED